MRLRDPDCDFESVILFCDSIFRCHKRGWFWDHSRENYIAQQYKQFYIMNLLKHTEKFLFRPIIFLELRFIKMETSFLIL